MKTSIEFIVLLTVVSFSASAFGDTGTDFLNSGIEKGQKHDYKGAIDDFTKAIELNPTFAEAYNERGLAEGALAKKDDSTDTSLTNALADYNTAIKLKPNYAAAYYNRGNVMQAEGDWNSAEVDFARVVTIRPKPDYALLAKAFFHLARLAERKGSTTEARLNYSEAYFNSGLAKQKIHDLDGALADYSKTIELDPSFFNYYLCRGAVKDAKKDWDGAIADFDKAIELKPDFSNSYYNRGRSKFSKGDLDGALADYSKAIELNPIDDNAFTNRGIVKNKMGDAAGSLADFNKAIELNPKKRDFLKAIGYLNDENGTKQQ